MRELKKFEPGKSYRVGNGEHKTFAKVLRRVGVTQIEIEYRGKKIRKKIHLYGAPDLSSHYEFIYPDGQYSMAAIMRADKVQAEPGEYYRSLDNLPYNVGGDVLLLPNLTDRDRNQEISPESLTPEDMLALLDLVKGGREEKLEQQRARIAASTEALYSAKNAAMEVFNCTKPHDERLGINDVMAHLLQLHLSLGDRQFYLKEFYNLYTRTN